jgi:hypothetical protein
VSAWVCQIEMVGIVVTALANASGPPTGDGNTVLQIGLRFVVAREEIHAHLRARERNIGAADCGKITRLGVQPG